MISLFIIIQAAFPLPPQPCWHYWGEGVGHRPGNA